MSKITEIIFRIFLCLVHQFSLKFTGLPTFIDQQKQHEMYTLKTENLFMQCVSQKLGSHKGNKKSCLSDASIMLWIQLLNEVDVHDDTTLVIKRFNYFLQLLEITTLSIYTAQYLFILVIISWCCCMNSRYVNSERGTNTASYLEAVGNCRHSYRWELKILLEFVYLAK